MHGDDCKLCSTSQGAGRLRPGHGIAPFIETTVPSNQLSSQRHVVSHSNLYGIDELFSLSQPLPKAFERVPLFAMHLTD